MAKMPFSMLSNPTLLQGELSLYLIHGKWLCVRASAKLQLFYLFPNSALTLVNTREEFRKPTVVFILALMEPLILLLRDTNLKTASQRISGIIILIIVIITTIIISGLLFCLRTKLGVSKVLVVFRRAVTGKLNTKDKFQKEMLI